MSTNKRPSKRQDWKTVSLYLHPETHEQLKRTALMQSLDSEQPLDQSDIADAAIKKWLAAERDPSADSPKALSAQTLPEAIASLVDAWLAAQDVEPAQQSQRREPRQYDPNEPQARFTVDLPKSLHKRLKQAAINHERPMTDMARDALADWLDMSEAP
jgi:predicted transcriptional regulator